MIEFRICEDLDWRNTPIFATINSRRWSPIYDEQKRFINELARFFSDMFDREVRWNHQGSLRGHYISK